MKQIDNYILEKLHIGKKNIPPLLNTESGTPIFIISIDTDSLEFYTHVVIFDKIVDNGSEYKINYFGHNKTYCERNLFINDNNYFQKNENNKNAYFQSVFLSNGEALMFLNNIKPNDTLNHLLCRDYFDSSNKKMFERIGTRGISLSLSNSDILTHKEKLKC